MKQILVTILHDLEMIMAGLCHQFDGGGLTTEEKMEMLRDYRPPYAH